MRRRLALPLVLWLGGAAWAAEAPTIIIEFADFECPSCKRARAPLEEILREFDGKIRLVHKDFPVPTHKGALPAAEAARCAAAQGAFWPYHDLLYLSVPDLSRNDLVGYAARLSLDRERFASCLDTHQFRQDIEADVMEGRALKLRGTPTFLVNGRPLEGAQPIEAFRDAIRNALRKASAP